MTKSENTSQNKTELFEYQIDSPVKAVYEAVISKDYLFAVDSSEDSPVVVKDTHREDLPDGGVRASVTIAPQAGNQDDETTQDITQTVEITPLKGLEFAMKGEIPLPHGLGDVITMYDFAGDAEHFTQVKAQVTFKAAPTQQAQDAQFFVLEQAKEAVDRDIQKIISLVMDQ